MTANTVHGQEVLRPRMTDVRKVNNLDVLAESVMEFVDSERHSDAAWRASLVYLTMLWSFRRKGLLPSIDDAHALTVTAAGRGYSVSGRSLGIADGPLQSASPLSMLTSFPFVAAVAATCTYRSTCPNGIPQPMPPRSCRRVNALQR